MKVGFTGTQHGMSRAQHARVDVLIGNLLPDEFHHGDCIGADFEAHVLARRLIAYGGVGMYAIWIVGHPPDNPSKRAWCVVDEMREPLPYLERNHVIVDTCDVMIATPRTRAMQVRSGTWATVRYAQSRGVPAFIVCPDGRGP